MTNEVDDARVFDSADAFERVDNDKELFFELVDMFFDDYESSLGNIQQAIESKESKQLEEYAHSIKSALGNLGAMKSFHHALFLERAGRSATFEGVEEVFEKLKESVVAFQKEAESFR